MSAKPPRQPPRIALCICTYDRYDLLGAAIDSAIGQSLAPEAFQVIVVDNSPDAARAEAFGRRYATTPHLDYIVELTPGLSNARNVAARICSAPIIAYMDDDAIAARTWAEELLKAFDAFAPQAMVAGGRVDPIWGAPRPAWVHDDMLGSLSVVDWGGRVRLVDEGEWLAGTNIAFRVESILAHGGFAAHLGRIGPGSALLSNEEVELLSRIRAAGGHVVYAPDARVSHLVDTRRLTRAWFRKRATWQAFSDFMMAPETGLQRAAEAWPPLVDYFNALPPLERSARGLFYDTENPDLFRWQTGAIYMMTSLMLAGFEGAPGD